VSDLTSLQPTIFLTIDFSKHIERGVVNKATLTAGPVDKEVADVVAQQETTCIGLSKWEHQPKGLKDMPFF